VLGACAQILELDRYQNGNVQPAGDAGAGGGSRSGEVLWAKRYGDAATQRPSALGVSDDGAIVFAGSLEGSLDVGCDGCAPLAPESSTDPFVAAVDVDGRGLWGAVLPSPSNASVDALRPVGASMWLSGSFDGSIRIAGTTLASTDQDTFVASVGARNGGGMTAFAFPHADEQSNARLAVNQFGEFAVAAETRAAGPSELLLRTFFDNGTPFWQQGYLSNGADEIRAIAIDAAGNVVIAGSVGGSIDFGCGMHEATDVDAFVAKLTHAMGECVWSQTFGGAGTQRALALTLDSDGAALVAGEFQGGIDFPMGNVRSAQGSIDAFLAALDDGGDVQWYLTSAAVGDERIAGVASTVAGRIVLGGDFSQALGFDDRHAFAGTPDGFVVVLEKDRTLRWSAQLEGGNEQRFVAVASHGDNVVALGEITGGASLGGWFLDNEAPGASIALAVLFE
jgi:hypothetical protein